MLDSHTQHTGEKLGTLVGIRQPRLNLINNYDMNLIQDKESVSATQRFGHLNYIRNTWNG